MPFFVAFNWALNRPVDKSTAYRADAFPIDSPVDGLIDKFFHSSHANNEGYTYWLVYLVRPVLIGRVVVYDVSRYSSNKDVIIFDNNDRLQNRRLCGTLPNMRYIENSTVTCSPPLYGQGVEIGKAGDHKLTLAEVEVYEFEG